MVKKNKLLAISYPFVASLCVLIISCKPNSEIPPPSSLCLNEGFTQPIGFYSDQPAFSWKLPVGAQQQKAYNSAVARWKQISLPGQTAVEIPEIERKVHRVQYLLKHIELRDDIEDARLYITALGLL